MEKLRNLYLANMPAKKDDPSYVAIRGHVPKFLYKKFKVFCLEREVDNSQGLEDLLRDYFGCQQDSLTGEDSEDVA